MLHALVLIPHAHLVADHMCARLPIQTGYAGLQQLIFQLGAHIGSQNAFIALPQLYIRRVYEGGVDLGFEAEEGVGLEVFGEVGGLEEGRVLGVVGGVVRLGEV